MTTAHQSFLTQFDDARKPLVEAVNAQFDSIDDPMQKTFAGIMLSYAAGNPVDMRETPQAYAVRHTPVSALTGV